MIPKVVFVNSWIYNKMWKSSFKNLKERGAIKGIYPSREKIFNFIKKEESLNSKEKLAFYDH